MYRVVTFTLLLGLGLPIAQADGQAPPPWRMHLMPWLTHAGQPRPWRDDPRLAGRSEAGYPDDFPVMFLNPDVASGGRHEQMWVRTIAYDAANDLFLGVLINKPDFIQSIRENDNAVFKVASANGALIAVGAPEYGAAGWPSSIGSPFGVALRDGIRAYRAGDDGHNMPEIRRCDAVLTAALLTPSSDATADERFVAQYVLGRCLAERYATLRAVDAFRAAIAIDSSDADAHMALLAELSVLTHKNPSTTSAAEVVQWDTSFRDELAIVRRRFASYPGVRQMLALIFNPAQEAEVDSIWRRQLPRLREVGYAVFRWKQR